MLAVIGVLSSSKAVKLQWWRCFAADGEWLEPGAGNSCVKGERLKSLVASFICGVVKEMRVAGTSPWNDLGLSAKVNKVNGCKYMLVFALCVCKCPEKSFVCFLKWQETSFNNTNI